MPSPAQVYVDQALTNLSLKYTNKDFIADLVAPVSQVDKETGLYFVYDKSNLRVENTARRGMSHSNQVDYATTTAPYGPLKEHSLVIGIPQAVIDQAQTPLDPRSDSTMTVTEKLMIEKEKNLVSILTNTAIVTQTRSLSGTDQFSDPANSDPFAVIQTAYDTIVKNGLAIPNTLTMGWEVWSKLKNHPDLIERVKYAAGGAAIKTLSPQDLAVLFDVENIRIGKAVENTAAEGQTASLSFVWGKNMFLSYTDGGSDIRTVTGLRTLVLKGGRAAYVWPDLEPGVGEWVKVKDQYEQKVIAAEAIYSILNAVA